tara:strand:+ start:84 stop:1124 length:1041 start_codon:yes stop_codon:yes gene_type:complete
MIDDERYNKLQPMADELVGHCQSKLGFERPPGLFFADSAENAEKDFGKTAYYDPGKNEIVVFVTNRHNKDILRSIAHEVVHHMQALRGDFEKIKGGDLSPGYAQKNPLLRKMEAEAYLLGNLLFRDWEDGIKQKEEQKKFTIRLGENKIMNKDTLREIVKDKVVKILKELLDDEKKEKGKKAPGEEVPGEEPELEEASGDRNDPDREAGHGVQKQRNSSSGATGVNLEEVAEKGGSQGEKFEKDRKAAREKRNKEEQKKGAEEGRKNFANMAKDQKAEKKKQSGDEEYSPEAQAGLERFKAAAKEQEEVNESKVWTTERENTLNESRFGKRRNDLFEKLMTSWIKK